MPKKRLATPPGKDLDFDKKLGIRIAQQREEARKNAEKKRSQRLAQKKDSAVETLAQAIAEISSMAQESSSTISELESTMTELSASAMQTAQATDESSTIVGKARGDADNAKQDAQTSFEKVESLHRHITTTADGISNLISGVNVALQSCRETVAQLNTLETQTSAIEGNVGGILKISDQINLFAINAAIEASRSGEYGAGFSVVADEVRKLAEQTSGIAEQITLAISAVKESVNEVNKDLATLLERTQTDAEKANEITLILEQSLLFAEEVRNQVDGINDLLGLFFRQMSQMEQNGEIIASGASQYSASLLQSSNAIREQSKGLESISKTAMDLDVQVNRMIDEKYTQEAAEDLATSAEEMSAVVEESTASIQQISSAITEITQTAGEQSSIAGENSELADKAVGIASEISAKAKNIRMSTQTLQDHLKTVEQESVNMIDGISNMTVSLETSAKKVITLATDLSGLERNVGKMNNVNLLTHLLAVSGRIESAKAGEHGAGFATVSEDIRQLVEQSANQIADISDGTRSIQETLKIISGDVEFIGTGVRKETENARKTTSRLVQMKADIVDVVNGVTDIQQTAETSHQALEVVKRSIESIRQAAEQASSACEEAAAAVNQQGQVMSELASAAEEIAAQADSL